MTKDFSDINQDLSTLLNSENGCEYIDLDPRLNATLNSNYEINVLHINIRSLAKNVDCLTMLLSDLRDRNVVVHLIGICETFLTETAGPLVDIENYRAVHRTRADRVGGGTSIYVHDSLSLLKVIPSLQSESFESIAVEVKMHKKKILMCEFYRPPNTNDSNFLLGLTDLISNTNGYDICFLCSDQNYDLLKSDVHAPTQRFLELMYDNKYIACILKPTRITHSSSTLIDNIFVKSNVMEKHCSYVVTDGMSDHYPCLVTYADIKTNTSQTEQVIEKRKFTPENIFSIQQRLLFQDWSAIHELDVNSAYKFLLDRITDAFDEFALLKRIKIKQCDLFREPWMSVNLRKYASKSRKLCNKARISGNPADFEKYKSYRNVLNRIKLHIKRDHYSNLFKKIGNNSQLLWNVVNGLLKKVNNRNEIVEILDGNTCLNPRDDICSKFNQHFASAGQRTQQTVRSSNNACNPLLSVRKVDRTFVIPKITEGQVCKIVKNMKPKQSCGFDNISNYMLQQLVSVIKLPMTFVFNKSIVSGVFPDLMKIAKILPLFKNAERNICDNYRPISLLPVLSKVLEKHVYQALVRHLGDNNILFAKQFGFRKHHSTTDAIMSLVGEALKAFDRGMMVLSVFVDLKKAFDTVPHGLLISKLQLMGVTDVALTWFQEYLRNRQQFVSINGCTSPTRQVSIGVPQGSILSVLLFNLVINDMPNCVKFSTCVLYADDTTLFVVGRSLRFLRAKLQSDLDHLSDWLSINRLKLNVGKTKAMLLSKDGLVIDAGLTFEGSYLETVNSFKFLGVVINSNLDFKEHYKMVNKKLLSAVFVITKLSSFLPTSCLRHLYFAYFESNISYGLIVWFPLLNQYQRDSLCKLQKRLIRRICKVPYNQHCMPLFKKERILSLTDKLRLENCKHMFRLSNRISPPSICNLYNCSAGIHRSRNSWVQAPCHTSCQLNKSFLVKPISEWIKLSSEIRNSEHLYVFAKKLKKDMFVKY